MKYRLYARDEVPLVREPLRHAGLRGGGRARHRVGTGRRRQRASAAEVILIVRVRDLVPRGLDRAGARVVIEIRILIAGGIERRRIHDREIGIEERFLRARDLGLVAAGTASDRHADEKTKPEARGDTLTPDHGRTHSK
jgi:hypothetical protein